MKFDAVLDVIERDLKGKRLASIRPGAELQIEEIDRRTGQLWLRTAKGLRKSRPISELRRIWEEMLRTPAVHVDSFLGGSGSSRNQPETILANLPFVEWFFLSGKKHIVNMGRDTHAPATLERMDDLLAEELKESLAQAQERVPLVCVLVTEDMASGVREMERVGIPLRGVEPGIYEQVLPEGRHWLVSLRVLEPGAWPVVTLRSAPAGAPAVELGGETFYVAGAGPVRRLVRVG